jgi:nicotinamidase-related amidase
MLIIDMMNTLDFDGGDELLKHALPAARAILDLKDKLREKGIPIIYVNDNFGQWRSSWEEVYAICSAKTARGCELAKLLKPAPDDYFVLKPKHSGFYSTTLEVLLEALGVKTVILSGVAGNICVLFTANDAHMRDYKVVVPRDCIASNTEEDNRIAIDQLGRVFGISTEPSTRLDLERLSEGE